MIEHARQLIRLFLLATATAILLAACVSQPDRRPEVQIQGEQQLKRGTHAYVNNDYHTAAAMFRESLALYQGIDDLDGIAQSRINLVETALAVGNYRSAAEQLDALDRLTEQAGGTAYRERARLLRATLAFREGRLAEAERLLAPLLPAFDDNDRTLGRPSEAGLNALASQARIASESSMAQAAPWLRRLANTLKMEMFKERPSIEALLQRLLARQAVEAGRPGVAVAHLEQALAAVKRAGDRRGIANTLQALARLHMHEERWQTAAELLQRALDVRSAMLDRAGIAAVLHDLILVEERLGNQTRAQALRDWRERLRRDAVEVRGAHGGGEGS
jgi:tetratricopeptide (TPR) repeat protein